MSRNHHKARWQVRVITHALSWRRQAGEYQQSLLQPRASEGRHVKDVIVTEKEEVVCVVEALDVVQVVVQELPATVKLVDGQRRWTSDARLQADAD